LLRKLAQILARSLRKPDILARYGGEEFVIILPETSKTNAGIYGEKIRHAIEKFPFAGKEKLPEGNLTISIGISTFPEDGRDRYSLIEYADQALYQAKKGGRNKVCASVTSLA
jgi:diguanylate cyclase (GGDEF)-like protein